LKVALRVSVPAAFGASEQAPVARVAVQLAPVLSVTVTVSEPGIVPLPGDVTATVKLTLTVCPTTDGFGVLAVIVVVVRLSATVSLYE
jgi:hypothetical protein